MRRLAVVLGVAFVASCLPARAQTPESPAGDVDRPAISALLERRAGALRSGDWRAFDETMRAAPVAFRRSSAAAARRLHALGVARFELELGDEYTDLAGAASRDRPEGATAWAVVQVTQRLALRGFDAEPLVEDLYLTVARDARGWSVLSDADLDDLGLLSSRGLWDFGDVRRIARSRVLVLHQGPAAVAERIARAADEAIAYVARRWPLEWNARAVVVIPRTRRQLSRMLRIAADLGPFVAFTSAGTDRDAGRFVLGGYRIYIQPETYFDTSAAYQRDTMSHEMLHIATRRYAGLYTPAWLDEGVAQIYGERARIQTADLRRAISSRRLTGLLAPDDFVAGSRSHIKAAYQASASFIRFLNARYGGEAGARMYRAVGAETPVSFGTSRYHLDRAARAVTRRTLRELEREWFATVRKELAA